MGYLFRAFKTIKPKMKESMCYCSLNNSLYRQYQLICFSESLLTLGHAQKTRLWCLLREHFRHCFLLQRCSPKPNTADTYNHVCVLVCFFKVQLWNTSPKVANAKQYAAMGLEALLLSYRPAVRLTNARDFCQKKKKRLDTALMKRKALVNVTKVTVLYNTCI